MAYHANLAAARRLVSEIMPRLWKQRPAARLLIVGPDPPATLRHLAAAAGPRVEITGYVADVRPYLARATVSVNPLPYAVGIQNKLLEAMAMATPVVATPAAGAALQAVAGEHFVIAETDETIAAAIERLFDDPALARRLGATGRAYVEAMHDWRTVAAELEGIYRDAISAGAAAERPNGARGPA
jgi:glycosyltransferase involved in cell wall biosynthesis